MKTIVIDGKEYQVTVLPACTGPKKSLWGVKSRAAKRRNAKYDQCHLL